MMTRVMFLVSRLGIGGAESQLIQLANGLDRDRFMPTVVTIKDPGEQASRIAKDVPLLALESPSARDPRIPGRIARSIRAERPHVLHCTNATAGVLGRVAARLAGAPPVVVAEHSTGRALLWQRTLLPAANVLLSRGTTVVACGRSQVSTLRRERHRASAIRVIVNGVDPGVYRTGADRRAAREELGIPAAEVTVGIVAALRPEKNHEAFLRVARLVADGGPQVGFVIVGDGPQRARLESLSAEFGLTTRVTFLGARADVPRVLEAMDVVMLTSHPVVETFPLSILEAMAAEIPVVATRVGDVADIVVEGVTGFVVDPGDIDTLTDRVTALATDQAARVSMGRAARQRLIDHFTLARMIGEYEALFDGLRGSASSVGDV